MATITRVSRQSGYAYKALVRLRGIKPFSKTFKRWADAKAWAERMERNIDQARAHGSAVLQQLTLGELIKEETLRALQEAIWRIDAAFRAVGNDESEDDHLSHAGELLAEAGMEAVSVSLNLIDEIPSALGININCEGDTDVFKRAYTRARSKDRATTAGALS